MDLFKYQTKQSVDRISYILSENLYNQVRYILLTEKIAFMESIYDRFSQKLEDIEKDMEQQAEMMSMIYQLYNHIQIDTFGMFFQLNNRFEYDNLWRFDMKVKSQK